MIRSPLKWMGGKSSLAREIVRRIPPHRTYVEPFAGALHVLIAKPPSPLEVVNDINHNLVNLWLCIRDHLNEMEVYLSQLPISESLFFQFSRELGYTKGGQDRYTNPSSRSEDMNGIPAMDPDIEKAAKYYYLIRCAFNGAVRNGISFSAFPHKKISISRQNWLTIGTRLKDVIILNRDYLETMKVYDTPETFFYLDPPYLCTLGRSDYYEHNLSREQHSSLPDILRGLEGGFLLSMDNTPEAWDLYDEFNIQQIKVKYTEKGELLIMNYDPPEIPFYESGTFGIPSRAENGIPAGYQDGIPSGYLPSSMSGIPTLQVRYTNNGSPAAFFIPNCPGCGSRKVQKLYQRHTLESGSRTFKASGIIKCMECGIPYLPGMHQPEGSEGIPIGDHPGVSG